MKFKRVSRMILSDATIKSLIKSKRFIIEPFDENAIQPSSIDLKISDEILFIEGKEVIFSEERKVKYREVKCKEIVIPPKKFVLVRTVERVELPNDIAGMVKLRSSLSRIGLFLN
ncbi:MAG: dCTP deaminase, partial [Candidatus Aenigmatarchaeota archaeon]